MNPNTFKLYKSICSTYTNMALCATSFAQKSFLFRFLQYSEYLVWTRAPRLSYIEHYSSVYTPEKVKFAAPICLTLAGVFFITELTLTSQAKENAKKYFEQNRE